MAIMSFDVGVASRIYVYSVFNQTAVIISFNMLITIFDSE
jgi:hypothetical protein